MGRQLIPPMSALDWRQLVGDEARDPARHRLLWGYRVWSSLESRVVYTGTPEAAETWNRDMAETRPPA
jgi:hypothetical protein